VSRLSLTEKIVTVLGSLTDPVKIATLKGDRISNSRLNKCQYWMRRGAEAGLDLDKLVTRALNTYNDTKERRALTRRSLFVNYRRMQVYGCFTKDNLEQLRHGGAAVITVGRFAGQKLEVDHVVPSALVPALSNEFANLSYQPFRTNRSKSDQVGPSQARAVRIFAKHGLVPETAVARMQAVIDRAVSVRSARVILPGTVTQLTSIPTSAGLGPPASDPQLIIHRVEELVHRIRDWEPRADSALQIATLVQMQTREHLTRTDACLGQAKSRVNEDEEAIRRLEAEIENWHTRGQKQMRAAEQGLAKAQAASQEIRRTLNYWSGQLNYSIEWRRRAIEWEEKCRDKVTHAEDSLSRARASLATAEERLERARNQTKVVGRDSDGRSIREPIDTTRHESRVREAEERVSRCEDYLERAEQQLAEAIEDRHAAEARVNSCERAVEFATNAEGTVAQGIEAAQLAINAVERASEEHARLNKTNAEATGAAKREQDAVTQMSGSVASAHTDESEATSRFLFAQKNHGEARERSALGCLEITWRLEQLRAFDSPVGRI
jgi:hypothetical protein